jgi:hypothetical protein
MQVVSLLHAFVKASSSPYEIKPRKCGMVLGQHHMVGFKVLRSFYANWGYSVQTSAECKTDRSAVLTVMSDLDPHMINKLKDEIKSWFDELCKVLL